MNQLTIKNSAENQQKRNQGPCYYCQGPHIIAQCPHKQNQNQNQQIQPYRGRQNYGYRGGQNFNRGYQNNSPRTFYRGGLNQNAQNVPRIEYPGPANEFNRGNYEYRGNANYRGNYNQNYRGMNPNYRGNYQNYRGNMNNTYQNYRPPQSGVNLQRIQNLLENLVLNNQPPNPTTAHQHSTEVPTITFPQNDPKNQ